MSNLKVTGGLLVAVLVLALAATVLAVGFAAAVEVVILPTVVIQADGSVYPNGYPIQHSGDTYTFVGNIYASIKILKSNIVLDGAGYMLLGPYSGGQSDLLFIGNGGQLANSTEQQYFTGVDLGDKTIQGITVENLKIQNFSIGMYMWTQNNTITQNTVSNCIVGILLFRLQQHRHKKRHLKQRPRPLLRLQQPRRHHPPKHRVKPQLVFKQPDST